MISKNRYLVLAGLLMSAMLVLIMLVTPAASDESEEYMQSILEPQAVEEGTNTVAVEPGEYSTSMIINWGESVNVSGYTITAVDFSPGTVEEPEDKTKCDLESNAFIRKAWGCDDYVMLEVFKNGDHLFDAILTESNKTISGSDFYNETIYEDAQGSLRIIALQVVTGKYIPSPYAELKILVRINKNDFEFDISNNFTIVKTAPVEANVNPFSEFIPVSISVKNTGTFDFPYIWVNDSTPEGFISTPQELGWGISLKKGDIWQKEYLIKPLKPVAGKEYTLPPAVLYVVRNNRTYNLSTVEYSFILRSSEIIVTKTVDNTEVREPGNVTVNISVKNNGSRAALVKVHDSILPGMEIVGGELNFSIVLQPDEFYNNSYILKLNDISDNISLPYAWFEFKEYWSKFDGETESQADTGSGISNQVEINFAKTAPTEVLIAFTENSKNTSGTPGFYESLIEQFKNILQGILKMFPSI